MKLCGFSWGTPVGVVKNVDQHKPSLQVELLALVCPIQRLLERQYVIAPGGRTLSNMPTLKVNEIEVKNLPPRYWESHEVAVELGREQDRHRYSL